jgi:hypothetical protein
MEILYLDHNYLMQASRLFEPRTDSSIPTNFTKNFFSKSKGPNPARRLLKNAQIQGASFDKLRINSPEECVVRFSTSQRREMFTRLRREGNAVDGRFSATC